MKRINPTLVRADDMPYHCEMGCACLWRMGRKGRRQYRVSCGCGLTTQWFHDRQKALDVWKAAVVLSR